MTDIEMSEEQARQVARAQADFARLKESDPQLDSAGLDLLFTAARSMNGWQDRPVSDDLIQRVYDIARMGATSANGNPARFVFVRTPEGKEKLKPSLAPNNVEKVMTAPVVVIVAHDEAFYERMDLLFPHAAEEVKAVFSADEELAAVTAFRNGSLQGAYLMLAARACGLDCGPMSGFDNAAVDAAFFAGTRIKSNFLCGLGYGNPEKIFQRLPRLPFEDACQLA